MTFKVWYEESTKTNNRVFTAQEFYEAGASSRQAEIDDALKQRDSFIKAHHIAMNDVCNLQTERDALQKRIDLIVDLVHDQTTDYFLDNLIQDILKGEKKKND